jgi:hypothetical protein
MSFGYPKELPIIARALNDATHNNVLLFAAASNNAGNKPISWPALRPDVICMHATDWAGDHCKFTPNCKKESNNFGIIGKNVKSYWPSHLTKDGTETRRKAGTSTATPIAAAVAAIVLGYARLCIVTNNLNEANQKTFEKLKTATGMGCVFRHMVYGRRDAYEYVVPWNFFDRNPAFGGHFQYIVLKDLAQNT